MFAKIKPTSEEVKTILPGDEIVANANVSMDRAFTLDATAEEIWPWFMQLGKNRAGWYFPRWVERFIPGKKRALHTLDPRLQNLHVGDVIDDWGGRDATFETAILEPPHTLVHKSKRGHMYVSWAIILLPNASKTRVHIRLRLYPVRRKWLANSGGELIDVLTIAGLEAGLRERLK